MSAATKLRSLTLFAAALFFLAGAGAFAYDGTAWGGLDGKFTRAAFSQEASEIERALGILLGFLDGNSRLERLAPVGPDDIGKEGLGMLMDLEAFIAWNFDVAGDHGFSHVIRRSVGSAGWDGWVVFSHYDSGGWLHYVYYFAIGAASPRGADYYHYYGAPVDA